MVGILFTWSCLVYTSHVYLNQSIPASHENCYCISCFRRLRSRMISISAWVELASVSFSWGIYLSSIMPDMALVLDQQHLPPQFHCHQTIQSGIFATRDLISFTAAMAEDWGVAFHCTATSHGADQFIANTVRAVRFTEILGQYRDYLQQVATYQIAVPLGQAQARG